MAVFPEKMDRLDPEDTRGSLQILEDYIRYMGERTEFSMGNMTRVVSEAGVSSVEVYLLLTELQNVVSVLSTRLQNLTGEMNTVKNELGSMKSTLTALDSRVTALEGKSN